MSEGPDGQGPVNLSPKGGTPLHIISPNRVAYLDYTGSGNQTARHAQAGGAITLMVMSMGKEDAAIVRLFGRATVVPAAESDLGEMLMGSPARDLELPVRQVVDVTVEGTQTSCGYGVPVYDYQGERPSLANWAEKNDLPDYRRRKNAVSIDGLHTGFVEDGEAA